jgi:hypothetical protein
VQVDPIKPALKAPGTKRLKLQYDEPPLNFAFKFNLHRYSLDSDDEFDPMMSFVKARKAGKTNVAGTNAARGGVGTGVRGRGLHSSISSST